jgi:hypothetical protein
MTETTSLPVIPDSRRDDLLRLKNIQQSQLNLFMAGNQFMSAFKQLYPEIRHIYCQTLPPGLQLKQILAGGALFRGQWRCPMNNFKPEQALSDTRREFGEHGGVTRPFPGHPPSP